MPAINRKLLTKYFSSTPGNITQEIIGLCREIAPSYKPQYVPVHAMENGQPSECFNNVIKYVDHNGGDIVYGWAIWEWPKVFIEAEHHAVWRSSSGLLDVTPHTGREKRILFLPDPQRVYDFVGKRRLLNVKKSLGYVKAAQSWIDAAHELQQYIEDNSTGEIANLNHRVVLELKHTIDHAKGEILVELASGTRKGDPCICRSGRRFSKCCSPLIDLSS